MRDQVYELKQPTSGPCGICGTVGLHHFLDRELRALVCEQCIGAVIYAQALLDAWQFEGATDPQKGEPNS